MGFTKDQEKAVNTRGGNILVSAAAGSGKTAVLSERVLKYVLDGYDITKLLVVTFTEAASLEMKVRIKQKIKEEAIKNSDEHLIKQLTLIDNAKITTMDSFYSELVKQNFEKLDIMPDFSILSSAEESIIKNKVINNLFKSYINDEEFISILHIFNSSSTDLIKEKIIMLSDFLDTEGFYKEYIKNTLDKYSNDYYKNIFIEDIKNKFNNYLSEYESLKEDLLNLSFDFNKLIPNINEEINIINKMLNVSNFDEISSVLRLISFSNQARITGHSDDYIFNKYKLIRSKLKNEVLKKLNVLVNITDEIYNNEMDIIKKIVNKLFEVTLDYKEKLLDEKKKINKFSFSDISLFTLKLLNKDGNKTDLAKKITKEYDEILIDETQDTNKLQNIIFNSISNGNNLFMVGDIKQSIYRFRSACPEIFNNYKNNYFKDKFPMLITLSKNFRSRNLVLDFCNFIFENLMSENLGEVSYNEDEMLYTGALFPDNSKAITEIEIINEKEKDDEDELSKVEKEAIYVANRIKELLDSKYQVYDKKGFYRDIKESDIVLLFRNLSSAEKYKYALENRGISVYLNKDIIYFDSIDVKIIISLLKVVSNYYDDVSLMTILMSNLFNVKEEDIVKVKINNKYDYLYDAIRKSNNKYLNEILDIIDGLNSYSKVNNLVDSIYYIYERLDVINKIGNDKISIKNLSIMIKNAKDFDNLNNKSLDEFISYIDSVIQDKSSFNGILPLSDGLNVTITTIHKSKGLEYPIVFLCDTNHKFNTSDYTKEFLLDSNYGISFDIFDYDKKYKYEPISNMVLKNKIKGQLLSEELRVLYVALTRAKEKLIITGYINKLEDKILNAAYLVGDGKQISNLYLETCDTYLKWIIGCLVRNKTTFKDYDLENKKFNYGALFNVNIIDASNIKDEVLEEKEVLKDNTKEEVINIYDNKNTNVPVYLSVSDIKVKDHKYVKKPYFLNSDKKSTNIGTTYHKILELLPVKKYSISSLNEELNNILTKDELKIINIEKIFAFLSSHIYDLMLKADVIYKEKELTFKIDASMYDNELDGQILTSGIIDLLFIHDNTFYIVDYKTDKVDTIDQLVDLYKVQLDLYEDGIKQNMNAKKIKKYIYSITLNKFIEV